MEFGIAKDVFEFNYKTPKCERGVSIYQTPVIGGKFEEKNEISMGKLGNDGVFRVYNHEGKVLSSIGEPCSKLGHCTIEIESSDIYANENVSYIYDCPDVPLRNSIVITNALGEKFYYPPPLTIPSNTSTTSTTTTTTPITTTTTTTITKTKTTTTTTTNSTTTKRTTTKPATTKKTTTKKTTTKPTTKPTNTSKNKYISVKFKGTMTNSKYYLGVEQLSAQKKIQYLQNR